jgi:hypothetical protein
MPDQLQDMDPSLDETAQQQDDTSASPTDASPPAAPAPAPGDSSNPVLAQVGSPLPPWQIPGTDWKFSPTFKGSTDDSHDTPQNHDRAEQKYNDDPRGNGPLSPFPSPFSPPKPDLTPPDNPFTPEAQQRIKEKHEAERREEEARQRLKAAAQSPAPEEQKGDYELPPNDPGLA